MNRKTILLLVGLVAVGLFLGTVTTQKQYGHYSPVSEDYNRLYWENVIAKKGGERAYANFLEKNSGAPYSMQHFASHVFGESLYKKEGINGITVCDASFGFGCFHGFFTTSLSEQGQDLVSKLDEKCLEKYGPLGTGCQHGIGHGILEFVGHDNINSALAMCSQTTQLAPLLGCTSGIFMEYFTPLVVTPEYTRATPTEFLPEEPFNICTHIKNEFKESCYFELAQWWRTASVGSYQAMGELCEMEENISTKESCYLGIGNTLTATYQYDVEEAVKECKKMPSETGETLCRAGVSWALFANPETKEKAKIVCEELSEDRAVYCLNMADLTKVAREKLNI